MIKVPFSEYLFFFRYFLQRLTGKNWFASFIAAAFLNFRNCEGPNLAKGFLHIFCPCFDIVFAPLGLITRTRYEIAPIVEIECYLIIIPF